jgi:hypothetical protein
LAEDSTFRDERVCAESSDDLLLSGVARGVAGRHSGDHGGIHGCVGTHEESVKIVPSTPQEKLSLNPRGVPQNFSCFFLCYSVFALICGGPEDYP